MVPLWIAVLVGLAAGLSSGFLGIGGGVVIVPSLMMAGVEPHVAIATSLVAIIVITLSGGTTHWRLGHVHLRTAAALAIPAIAGAQIGALVAIKTPTDALKAIYGVFLLVLSIRFLRGASPLRAGRPRSDPRVVLPFGLGVGVLGAFLGIGGGIVMVLFMTIYMGFDIRRAIGTSTVVIIVNALAGTAQYLHQGIPDVPAGIAVGIAGALTATFGARATIRIPRATLRRIFGVFLLVVALRFLGVYSAAASLL